MSASWDWLLKNQVRTERCVDILLDDSTLEGSALPQFQMSSIPTEGWLLRNGLPNVGLGRIAIHHTTLQGEYEEAESLYERAISIWEAALGCDHPQVAVGLFNQAELLSQQVSSRNNGACILVGRRWLGRR